MFCCQLGQGLSCLSVDGKVMQIGRKKFGTRIMEPILLHYWIYNYIARAVGGNFVIFLSRKNSKLTRLLVAMIGDIFVVSCRSSAWSFSQNSFAQGASFANRRRDSKPLKNSKLTKLNFGQYFLINQRLQGRQFPSLFNVGVRECFLSSN
jgi:hypothetical protein